MNEKQKIVFLAVAVMIGLLLGYLLGAADSWRLRSNLNDLESQVEQLYEQAETADYQKHIAEVELGIEQAASAQLEEDLAASRDEISTLRREIAFYQKIMAPEMIADGIAIDDFSLRALEQEGHYQFRFAIVQTDRVRNFAKGTLEVLLQGRVNGERVSFDLYDLADLSDAERSFSMRFFKAQSGSFELPTNFAAEEILVRVSVNEPKAALVERTYLWSDLRN